MSFRTATSGTVRGPSNWGSIHTARTARKRRRAAFAGRTPCWLASQNGHTYPRKRAVISPGRCPVDSYFLFRWNREILEMSALLGNVEGQRFRGSSAAGILHVVHFAGGRGERLAGLQGHSGLALRL